MSQPPRTNDPDRDSLLMALKMGPVPTGVAPHGLDRLFDPEPTPDSPRPDPELAHTLPGAGYGSATRTAPRMQRDPRFRPPGPRPNPARIPAVQLKLFKDWGIPEWFIVSQAFLFLILFIPGMSSIRLLTKIANFFTSLLACWLVYRGGYLKSRSASFKPTAWISVLLSILALMMLHPGTNSPVSGAADLVLWSSVYCVAYWATAALKYGHQLQRVFLLIFLINCTSALLGIGQFYKPNIFLPPSIGVLEKGGISALIPYYQLDDGTEVMRPCGMSDNPGAAAPAGAMAAVMGIVILTSRLPTWQRAMGLVLAVPAATVIYLTQGRTAILMVVVSLMALVLAMALQNRWNSVMQIGVAGAVVVLGGFAWAAREGGKSIVERYFTLLDGSPTKVLGNSSRAHMVSDALGNQVFEMPLGAGLGRYGQVYGYFGNWAYNDMIWVETQVSAWLVDGGIPILFLGFAVVILGLIDSLRVARTCPSPSIAHWAAGVFALNVSVFFACFGQMPFLTNIGQQFWLLAGMTHAADKWVRYQQRKGLRVP